MSSVWSLLASLHRTKPGGHAEKVGQGRREVPVGPGDVSAIFVKLVVMALFAIHWARSLMRNH